MTDSIGLPPVILTVKLDADSFNYFDALRKKYFPPHLNYLDAHLTMFHHLPHEDRIQLFTKKISSSQRKFALNINALMLLGSGVAYKVQSETLMTLHATFRQAWMNDLTPQDRQGYRPHITVQNKVKPDEAKELYHKLNNEFKPIQAMATGLTLWEYLGGPWKILKTFDFSEL